MNQDLRTPDSSAERLAFDVKADAFLAGFFGGPVLRLKPKDTRGNPVRELDGIVAAARGDGVKLVDCRVPAGDDTTAEALKRAGFREVETLVTLQRAAAPMGTQHTAVDRGSDGDIDACKQIARTAFWADRFHADPRIDDTIAEDIKAEWIANSLRGRGDIVLVAREDDVAVGFVACLVNGNEAMIDLIAVDPKTQGRGVGTALAKAAINHYASRVQNILVRTQATNQASLSVYQKTGFEEARRARTYHLIP